MLKSIFFFQNIMTLKCFKHLPIRSLQYIYKYIILYTFRNRVRECTCLHDVCIQILSLMESWALLKSICMPHVLPHLIPK